MKKVRWLSAFLMLSVLSVGVSTQTVAASPVAVGSARTTVEVLTGSEEKASFAAVGTGVGCEARGHITYQQITSTTFYDFKARVAQLTVVGQHASFWGPLTHVAEGNPPQYQEGRYVWFNVFDSNQPGGTGDGFNFRGVFDENTPTICPPNDPILTPITKGNIVVKSDA